MVEAPDPDRLGSHRIDPPGILTPPNLLDVSRAEKIPKRLARLIVRDVAARRLPEGTSLPSEQAMAKQYGVGRASVREALRLLEAQGLLYIRPGVRGGPVVGSPSARAFGETLTMFLQYSGTPIGELIDAAAALSGDVCFLAAKRSTKAGVKELRRALEEEARSGMPDTSFVDTSIDFHAVLRKMLKNDILSLMDEGLGHLIWDRAVLAQMQFSEDHRSRITEDHRAILEAVAAHDFDKAREIGMAHTYNIVESALKRFPFLAETIVDWR